MRPWTRAAALAAALAVAVGGVVVGGQSAIGAPPSDDDVAAARARSDAAALDVAGAEARLDALRGELTTAQNALQTAAADYDEALERLDAATREADAAKSAYDASRSAEAKARDLLAEAYRVESRGDGFGPLSVVTGSGSVADVVADDVARRAVDRRVSTGLAKHADARATAATAGARWEAAQEAHAAATTRAEEALDVAQQSYAALEALTASATTERDTLIQRLAELRNTTVQLERERQDAREAAAAAAAREAERLERESTPAPVAPPVAPAPAPTPAPGPTPRPTPAPTPTPAPAPRPTPTPTPAPAPAPAPAPTPTPTPTPAPAPQPPTSGSSHGSAAQGQAAVAWARTQIGVMYQWGGNGNPGWDCSGLTSAAWRAQGLNISRSSRSQYQTVAKISYSQLRPGDLLFWANNPNDPSTIRHVAIYSGNGKMVEAVIPGVAVRETAVRWDSDLMPYAGRP